MTTRRKFRGTSSGAEPGTRDRWIVARPVGQFAAG